MKQFLRDSSNYDESHNPASPDKKKPWCLNCRLHTNWYSVYKGQAGKQHKVLRCEVCDDAIYWPISPTKSKVIAIAIVGPFFLLGSALIAISFDLVAGALADEEKLIFGLGAIAVGIFMAYTTRNINKKVRKDWADFHKWAEEQSAR